MIIGIDLGTTFSVVATVGSDGRPVVLPNQLGERTTPSVVYFESASSVLVGSAAWQAGDPDNTVALIKRQMGTAGEYRFHGVAHTPESVSALILRGLADAAAARLGADGVDGSDGAVRAVITVPAYFGIREREATYQAARLAGIEVLELLAEPVAAALRYGTSELATVDGGGAVLVYDLGGGTFDTTVLRMTGDGITVVATDGDSQLGGADWDERIADYLTEAFVEAVAGEVDVEADDSFPQQVLAQAEAVKRALSSATARQVRLRCAGRTATVPLDRETLTELGADLVERTMAIVARTLDAAAEKGIRRIDQVVLAGGATRMPAIGAAVTERLGLAPKLLEPDFAVALGAAVRAHQLAGEHTRANLRRAGGALARTADAPTASVLPRSLGVLVEDSFDPAVQRRFVHHLVHRNQTLPATGTARFATIVPGQDRIRVQVFEQAGDVPSEELTDNQRVLDGELRLPAGLPAATPIEITLRISADGLLQLSAVEPSSGRQLNAQAYVDGVVDTAVAQRLSTSVAGLTVRH